MTQSNRYFAILGTLFGLLLVQACSRELPPEPLCNFVPNKQSRRVSWGPNLPIKIYMDQSVPRELEPSIIKSIEIWNEGKGQELFRYKGYTGSDSPRRDGVNKIYYLKKWDSEKKTEQARTTVYWSGSRIYEADIRLNDEDFNFFTLEDEDRDSKVNIESLMVHELGHALGLAHNENVKSVMQESLALGRIRAALQDEDLASLDCEY